MGQPSLRSRSTLVAIHVAAIPISGASVNPARSLGPAIVGTEFHDLWIYLIAPPIGAVLGWLAHRVVVLGDTSLRPVERPARGRGRLAALDRGARGGGRPRRALEERLDALHLTAHVVRLGGGARRLVRPWELGGGPTSPRRSPPRPAGRRARPHLPGRTRVGRPPASRRPSGRRPSPRASSARTARRGSAGTRRPRPRATAARRRGRRDRRRGHRAVRRAAARSGPSPTNASDPSPWRAKASARRVTFFRSLSVPTQRNAVPSGSQPSSARAVSRSPGANRSRSTPQSITVVLPAAPGAAASRRSRSQSETAMTDAARRTARRVAPRITRERSAFATSWPWAVRTAGARPAIAPSSPAGTRKCA